MLSYLTEVDNKIELRFQTLNENDQWSGATIIVTGQDLLKNWADFPSVVPVTDTLWAAHWLRLQPGEGFAYDAMVALSHDAGQTWEPAQKLHDDTTNTEHGFVSLFERAGSVGAVWLDGRASASADSDSAATQLRHREISITGTQTDESVLDAKICDCCQTDVAIASTGPIIVYRDRSDDEIRDIYAARQVDGKWQSNIPVAHDGWKITGCPVNGPAIAASGQTVAVAWFTASPSNRVRIAFSPDSGQTFNPAIDVATEQPIGRVDVELIDPGTAVVSWLERGVGELRIRTVRTNGTLGDTRVVTRMETHRDAGFPRMIKTQDHLVLAWTDTSGEASTIRTARFEL